MTPEYHVTRNGVDQESIVDLLRSRGFACELIRYLVRRLGLPSSRSSLELRTLLRSSPGGAG